jgi:phosphomannomutase
MRENVFLKPKVLVACDTRGSSKRLVAAIKEGLECLGVECEDHGLLSTP